MYMRGLSSTLPASIPLDTMMQVSPTGVWSAVPNPSSDVFESNFPAQPNGSGLYTNNGAVPGSTIMGVPTKTVIIGAVIVAILLYLTLSRKEKE